MKKFTIIAAALILLLTTAWFLKQRAADYGPSAPASSAAGGMDLSSRVSRMADSSAALAARIKAAREISTDLGNSEIRELMAFLARPLDERNQENDLMAMNEVMNKLRLSGMACGEYATALCGLMRDPQTHPVVRDYAIQHAASWIQEAREGSSPAQISPEDEKRMLDCMVAFLQQPESTRETGYGTTLNVLRTLESQAPVEVAEFFAVCAPRVVGVASGREPATLANRVSAIQSLPSVPDRPAALALVRGILKQDPEGSPVRLVAVATLGELGDKDDLPTLRQIQQDNPRLSYAARAATARLESNLLISSR